MNYKKLIIKINQDYYIKSTPQSWDLMRLFPNGKSKTITSQHNNFNGLQKTIEQAMILKCFKTEFYTDANELLCILNTNVELLTKNITENYINQQEGDKK